MRSSARQRIERFLRDHPDGTLLVAVGYASAAGLTWLNQVTQGRSVKLLIGDARRRYWTHISSGDAKAATAFIRRDDTEVRNWYRTTKSSEGEAEAHLKVWVVQPGTDQQAALVGSANLTKHGLDQNIEALVEARDHDLGDVSVQVRELWEDAWDTSHRLLRYIDDSQAQTNAGETPRDESPRTRSREPVASQGTLPRALSNLIQLVRIAGVIFAAIIGLVIVLSILSGIGEQNSSGPPEGVLSEQAVVESAGDLL